VGVVNADGECEKVAPEQTRPSSLVKRNLFRHLVFGASPILPPNSSLHLAFMITRRPPPLVKSTKNISRYLYGAAMSLYSGGQHIVRSSLYYQRWR